MKKKLLILICVFANFFVSAQCVPDSQFTAPGIYPDTALGLDDAIVGQPYNQVITIITPLDTSVEYNGIPIPVTIEYIELTSFSGLPPNFAYDCLAPNCIFDGGSTSCAVLYSTSDPTSADIGSYQLIMTTTTSADAGLGIPITQDDIIDYYYLDIVNTTSTINYIDNTTFELKDVHPNPANNNAKIQYVLGTDNDIYFELHNLLGEKVESRLIKSQRGVNTFYVNVSNLTEGIYLYSITNGDIIQTKKMIIKH
tara:strand:- start:88 stop:849 length:762 start_codon:yes stop_codon:yes gene_type:complete